MTHKKNTPMSAEKAGALAKAQAASKAANEQYGSPRQRGLERAHEAIEWTYKWGWTTPTILEINAGSFRSGLANRLIKSGVMARVETASGGINNTPTFLLTLTQKGLEKAVELTDLLLPYETDPHKISQKNIPHDELVQRLTALNLWITVEDGGIDDYVTPKILHKLNANETKIPDVIWKRKNKNGDFDNFAVEVELTSKDNHEFDRFVTMTAALLSSKKENGQNTFQGIQIFSKSPALITKYSAAFQAGEKTPLWLKEQGKTGRWKKKTNDFGETVFFTMPASVQKAIQFTRITAEMIQNPKSQA